MSSNLVFTWCHDHTQVTPVTALFLDNLSTNYISHSELQYGRADAPGKWSKTLPETLAKDIAAAIDNTPDTAHLRLATAYADKTLLGVAFISIDTEKATSHPFATIEDMVISPAARGQGIGRLLLDWVSTELGAEGIQRLFLESGIGNDAAHHFFEREGFQQISVVMMKALPRP
jgi:GNAT superfamily N-acetyltransferase